jgi:hypothetical protein
MSYIIELEPGIDYYRVFDDVTMAHETYLDFLDDYPDAKIYEVKA